MWLPFLRAHHISNIRFATAILLASATSAFGQTYIATTFAGSVVPENLPATSISLGAIACLASDSSGNIFLAVLSSAAVFRVDAETGILTRVAGIGTSGFSGDGGPAVNAQLSGPPSAMAVDLSGNLYLADNLRVRKVANGVITTVAGTGVDGSGGDGGPALSAQLNELHGLAADAAGNLYLLVGSGVRKIANGVITSVPGAAGTFWDGFTVDPAGNLFLVDGQVLKVANGTVTVLAGNGIPGFFGDNGPATSAGLGEDPGDCGVAGVAADSAGNVYIADECNNRIRKVSNGIITTVAGGGSSPAANNIPATAIQLDQPNLIAVDSAGNLYIAQEFNQGAPVLKIVNGVATQIAGNGARSFSGDGGPAGSAQFDNPAGVAVDSAGRVYIADAVNNRVRMISNGIVTTIAGTGSAALGGDGGPAVNAQLSLPAAVALNPAGDLFIADVNNRRVRKVSQGVITTVNGTVGYNPCSVAADSAGRVYLFDCRTHQILRVSNGTAVAIAGNGTELSNGENVPATSAGVAWVNEMAIDLSGDLYLSDSGRIRKVSNGVITTVTGGTGVTLDAGGTLYAADGKLNLIRRLSGGVAAFPTNPPTQLQKLGGYGYLGLLGYAIAADSSGDIYGSDGTRIVLLKSDGSTSPSTSSEVDFINNAASNSFAGIAPGEIVTLIGRGLGPAQLVSAQPGDDGFYATQLAGTTVQFNGVAAPLIYTSATQVSAVAPYGVSGPNTQVTVNYQGKTSIPATIAVFPSAPGLFTGDGSGVGQAAAVNQDGTLNSPSNPAPIGSVISFFVTGGGQTSPAGVDGTVATAPLARQAIPLAVQISGSLVGDPYYVQYVGAAPGEIAGVTQINFQIPPGITTGSAVSFGIVVGNTSPSQPGVTIAVSPSGN